MKKIPSRLVSSSVLGLLVIVPGLAFALPMDRPASMPSGWSLWGCAIETQESSQPELRDLNAEFKLLCSRDSECFHLKRYSTTNSERSELEESGSASGGLECAVFKEPSATLLSYLANYSYEFYEASSLYKVPEAALIGSILAENTLNVSLDDKIQDQLAGLSGGMATPFSIGLGQVFPARARQVEQMAAWMEKRPVRSDAEIQTALLTERGSIFYVAAILRDAWKTYRRYGVDVRQDIPVLSTLYNLGDVEARARRAGSAGATPKENYFGFFVRHHRPLIESLRLYPGMRPME